MMEIIQFYSSLLIIVHLLYFEEDLLHVNGTSLQILFIVVALVAHVKIYVHCLLNFVFIGFHSDTFKNWALQELKSTRPKVGVYLQHIGYYLDEVWITTG